MFNYQRWGFAIGIIIFLLAVAATGVFFVYDRWLFYKEAISNFRELSLSSVRENQEKDSKIMEEKETTERPGDLKESPETKSLDKKEPDKENPILEAETVISQTQEFIAETQEFIKKRDDAISNARRKSSNVRGVYINEFIANGQGKLAKKTRDDIKKFIDDTELNSVVIDIKEAYGPNLPSSLKKFVDELHQKDAWVIARMVVFRDSSLIKEKPNWYLKAKPQQSATSSFAIATSTPADSDQQKEEFWKDSGGGYWLDPASLEVQKYIIDFSKRAIDFGFDELQFDYIRFPSDGDLKSIIYPVYQENVYKYKVIGEFFSELSKKLKSYKPQIILSVDLFGLVASQLNAFDIGQRIADASGKFDYLSFMLYPSHFYGGFVMKADPKRNLPALYFPYQSAGQKVAQATSTKATSTDDISSVVSNHPYEVVSRSIFSALDHLSTLSSQTKIRPWLQGFDLAFDVKRGIIYDKEKVRAQIQAAEDSGASGWLIWNSANIYQEAFFLKTESL